MNVVKTILGFPDLERPTKCPFLLNHHERYGENKNTAKWKCEIEKIGMDDDRIEQCVTDYQKCIPFSLGVHYQNTPRVCPCASHIHENVCSLREYYIGGRGCGHRESYEYLQCELFSGWVWEQRRGRVL